MQVMLGSSDSYPYPNFPHDASFLTEENTERLKSLGIMLANVELITPNEDDFCILTMTHYVDFTATIAPLCLPEFPNSNYNELNVKVFGFGYGSKDSKKGGWIYQVALLEVEHKIVRSFTSRSIELNTKVISRHDCQNKYNPRGGKIPAKNHEQAPTYFSSPLKLDM